ncbi:MAG: EamA family transporter [Frankiales bacterium]|nr:EamA family transporter [Frankiales bacterium]
MIGLVPTIEPTTTIETRSRWNAPPQVLVLTAALSVQFGSAVAAKLFDAAGPGGVVFMRLAFAAVILIAVIRPRVRGRSRSDWIAAGLFAVALGGMNWSFYEALHLLPLGIAVTVEFTGPLAVAVLGSRRLLDLVWVALAAGGVLLLGVGRGHTSAGGLSLRGLGLALLAGAFWAGYIVVSKRVGAAYAGIDGLVIALAIAAVLLLPVGIVSGGDALLRPSVIAGGLLVAVLSSIIPYSLEITALRRLSAATFGLLMSLEPAVAALAGVLVLSQPLHLITSIALVMVIAASAGSSLSARNSAPSAIVQHPASQ